MAGVFCVVLYGWFPQFVRRMLERQKGSRFGRLMVHRTTGKEPPETSLELLAFTFGTTPDRMFSAVRVSGLILGAAFALAGLAFLAWESFGAAAS